MNTFPDPDKLLLFFGAATLLIVVPGPAILYVIAKSVEQGTKAGITSVLGVGLGGLVHVIAATLGLSAILMASATAFTIVKFA